MQKNLRFWSPGPIGLTNFKYLAGRYKIASALVKGVVVVAPGIFESKIFKEKKLALKVFLPMNFQIILMKALKIATH